MDASSRAISPLRQRMIDDMRMCKLSPKTQLQYIRAVKKLTGFVGRSPDTSGNADCDMSCRRSALARTHRTAEHDRPAPRCGTVRWRTSP